MIAFLFRYDLVGVSTLVFILGDLFRFVKTFGKNFSYFCQMWYLWRLENSYNKVFRIVTIKKLIKKEWGCYSPKTPEYIDLVLLSFGVGILSA
jgi:hypothetical protein